MDGLTIFQAIVGGLQVIDKTYRTAEELLHAPDAIQGLLSELVVTKSILEQLRPLILDRESLVAENAQHIGVGDFVLVFTDLAKTLSNFDKVITQISLREGVKGAVLFKSAHWVKNKAKFERDIMRLQNQKLSLNVMLSLLEK